MFLHPKTTVVQFTSPLQGGRTALMMAAAEDKPALVRVLLKYRASTKPIDKVSHSSHAVQKKPLFLSPPPPPPPLLLFQMHLYTHMYIYM